MDEENDEQEGMTETEKAIWARKKKQEVDYDEEIREYMEQREEEMRQLVAELEELKERQAERRLERQEEMERMQEMQRAQEEQRKADEEERKARQNAEKRKKEADRKKKLELMQGGGICGLAGGATGGAKPNFLVAKSGEEGEQGLKVDPTQSKEEFEAHKQSYLAKFAETPDFAGMDLSELRMRIKGMHEQISKHEAAKYDMEERLKTQEYDLKELKERAKQQARQKAIKKGLDPEEYANAKHPPKKAVASKFDRQTDRRDYGDRRTMFEKELRMDGKPAIPPPKAIFHGSTKPPEHFGRPALKNDELETLRKILEPPKYQETAPVENAKPPAPIIPAGPVPEDDEVGSDVPPPPKASVPAPAEEAPPADEPAEPEAAEEAPAEEEE